MTDPDLAESARQFQLLADSMPQMVWKAGSDGALTYVNQRWLEYTGRPVEGALEALFDELVHRDDRATVAARWEHCLRTREDFEVWARLRRHDGVHRWHVSRARPLRDAEGRVFRWFGTATDVDDKRRADDNAALLALLCDALFDALDLPAQARAIGGACVPAFADYCGVYLCDDEGGLTLLDAVSTDASKLELARASWSRVPHVAGRRGIVDVMRTGGASLHQEVSAEDIAAFARDPDELDRLQQFGARSSIDVPLIARGRTIGALAFCRMSTDRRYDAADLALAEDVARRSALAIDNAQLLELAQRERRRAEEANQLKDEFLASLSHELRTPLTAVLGWARLLRDGSLTGDRRSRAVEIIERNAIAQKRLIDDLLDVSRIVAGHLHLELGPLDLALLVEATIDAMRPAAEAKGQVIRASIDPAASRAVGDAIRLRQVVHSLLANAVKFTPNGGSIDVRLACVAGGITLSVTDDGEGICPEFLPHVFDRFRMADAGITRQHGGLGIGLTIARHIVELHGGALEARSGGWGRGSTFEVHLPPPAPRVEPTPAQRSAEVPDLRGLRVLVVDDEPDTRGLVAAMLDVAGASVDQAESAASARAAIALHPPDVMVSDLAMPGEDGYALLRALRVLPRPHGGGARAVALTAYARAEDRTQALQAGFDAHVGKPIDPHELLAVVARLAMRA